MTCQESGCKGVKQLVVNDYVVFCLLFKTIQQQTGESIHSSIKDKTAIMVLSFSLSPLFLLSELLVVHVQNGSC